LERKPRLDAEVVRLAQVLHDVAVVVPTVVAEGRETVAGELGAPAAVRQAAIGGAIADLTRGTARVDVEKVGPAAAARVARQRPPTPRVVGQQMATVGAPGAVVKAGAAVEPTDSVQAWIYSVVCHRCSYQAVR
jgi:hypothetical protein